MPDRISDDRMPDIEASVEMLAGRRCQITRRGNPDALLLQPIDARETLSQEASLLAAQCARGFLHVAFPVDAWNDDLSPWDAPPVFGKNPFGHGATDTLDWLLTRLIPAIRAQGRVAADVPLMLGGYSLSGLFSLWSATRTDAFSAIAAMSPSVWFPGWNAYAQAHPPRTRAVYLSLGDREERSRNPLLRTVGDAICTEEARLTARGISHTLCWNAGNHFQDAEKRCADGFAWCMNTFQGIRDKKMQNQ